MTALPNSISRTKIDGSPYIYCVNSPGLVCNGFRHYTTSYISRIDTKRVYTLPATRIKRVLAPSICPHEIENLHIYRVVKQQSEMQRRK